MESPGFRRVRRFSLGRRDRRREVEEELAFHLASSERDLAASGLPAPVAREEAARRFGDLDRYRRQCLSIDQRRDRAQQRGELVKDLLLDFKYALRSFRKSPAFLAGTVLTLALGIGGATAVFSVVYGVLLKPLPFPEPARLVHLWEENAERGWSFNEAAPANFLDWRERARSFTDITAYRLLGSELALTGDGEPEPVPGTLVYANFFDVLGLRPVAGRWFEEHESWQGTAGVVVISQGLWQRRFGADPALIGKTINLNGRERTVVGIAPPGIPFPKPGLDFWLPIAWELANRTEIPFRRVHSILTLARLKPGVSPAAANAELEAIAAALEKEYPETNRAMGAGLMPLDAWMSRGNRLSLLVLLAAVGLLLAVACANVAHMLLARAAPRGEEMDLRTALGASRFRVLRQLLAESLLLATAGGALGWVIASWGTSALLALAPADLPRRQEIGLDGPVLAFAIVLTLGTTLLFGAAPAVKAMRGDALRALASGRGLAAAGTVRRGGRVLVVAEIALSLVLVVGATLFGKSLLRLTAVDPGFQGDDVLAVKLMLPGAVYSDTPRLRAFYQELLDRVGRHSGVESVSLTTRLPGTGTHWTSDFAIEGRDREDFGIDASHRSVSPSYFGTLAVPVLAGRAFTAADSTGAEPVVILNQTLARLYFPNESPLGKRLCFERYPSEKPYWRTVVGVVADEKMGSLSKPSRPEILDPFLADPDIGSELLLRSSGDPLALVAAVRAEVRALDRDLPLYEVRTVEQLVAGSLVRERFLAFLLGLFAAAALALAALGTYALLAYQVALRRREIGIRMALGARVDNVLRLVVTEAVVLSGIGLALGTGIALVLTRRASSLLYEVSPADPAVFAAVALCLAAVAAVASFLPARRAARIDPALTLREE